MRPFQKESSCKPLVIKQVWFDENEHVGATHLPMNGFEDPFWHRGKRQLGNG